MATGTNGIVFTKSQIKSYSRGIIRKMQYTSSQTELKIGVAQLGELARQQSMYRKLIELYYYIRRKPQIKDNSPLPVRLLGVFNSLNEYLSFSRQTKDFHHDCIKNEYLDKLDMELRLEAIDKES